MNLFRIILVCFISTIGIFHLSAQKTFTTGVILNKEDSSIIYHAHIINISSKTGVTSNQEGEFSLQTKLTDTLEISFIGFYSLKIIASEIQPIIYLERAIYTIEPYTVLPYKDFNEFRDAFVALELEGTVTKINASYTLSVEELRSYVPPSLGLLKYRNKDKENYERLLAKDRYETFLATKFNPNVIKRTTLLRDGTQINSFMEYCDFPDQFIEFSSQYNLFDQIINCFDEYNSLPMADN